MTNELHITIHVTQTHELMLAAATLTIHWVDGTAEIFLGSAEDPIFAICKVREMAEDKYGPIDNVLIDPITAEIRL